MNIINKIPRLLKDKVFVDHMIAISEIIINGICLRYKAVRPCGNSARVFVPKELAGKRYRIIMIPEEEQDKPKKEKPKEAPILETKEDGLEPEDVY